MRIFESGKARAAVFVGAGEPLELIEAAVPSPATGEILVEIECCAICSSDLHTHSGRRIEPTPTVLGHEIVGRIMRFGTDAVKTDARGLPLEAGDRITWTVAASCGRCVNCRDGLEQKCLKLVKYGHEKVSREMPFRGGLADVVLLSPGTGIVKLSSDLSDELPLEMLALANCSTATVAAVLRAGFARRNRPGMSVAVLGVGVLGLTACAMAKEIYQASVIIACDRDADRAESAKAFGATHSCTDLSQIDSLAKEVMGSSGVDVAVELAGSIHTARAAVAAARIGGTVILAGTTTPTDPLVIEPQAIIRRLLRIEGVHNYVVSDLVCAVDFLLKNGKRFPMRSLIGNRYKLSEVEEAFAQGHLHAGMRMAVVP
jgi:putative phosphonate catabolism associated alcohol dehydrogenase